MKLFLFIVFVAVVHSVHGYVHGLAQQERREVELNDGAPKSILQQRGASTKCQETEGTCGGTFRSTNGGCFASPNYPNNNYGNDQDCVYELEVEEGSRVELNIEFMDIEEIASCLYDKLEIIPGSGFHGALRICGKTIPKGTFVSLTNKMTIRFRSDPSITQRGFAASFRGISV